MIESSLQTQVLKYLNGLNGCIAENVSGNAMQSGRADINGCYRGQCFRIELKVPDNRNKASTKQLLNIRKWQNAGALTMVAYSLDFVKSVFTNQGLMIDGHISHAENNGCVSYAVIKNERVDYAKV